MTEELLLHLGVKTSRLTSHLHHNKNMYIEIISQFPWSSGSLVLVVLWLLQVPGSRGSFDSRVSLFLAVLLVLGVLLSPCSPTTTCLVRSVDPNISRSIQLLIVLLISCVGLFQYQHAWREQKFEILKIWKRNWRMLSYLWKRLCQWRQENG